MTESLKPCPCGKTPNKLSEANAHLISAAPDLLKALEDIAEYYPNSRASDTARAAIAKATRVQP